MVMLIIMTQWFGMLGLFFLIGWVFFRLGWARWGENMDPVACDAADGSSAACAGGCC